jgi:hypothetical protein
MALQAHEVFVMKESTTTLRFPDRLHSKAKSEAARRGIPLQEFVSQAVEAFMSAKAPHVPPVAARIAAMPARTRKMTERFGMMIDLAPDFYIPVIDRYVGGMLTLFRRIDKNTFEGGA